MNPKVLRVLGRLCRAVRNDRYLPFGALISYLVLPLPDAAKCQLAEPHSTVLRLSHRFSSSSSLTHSLGLGSEAAIVVTERFPCASNRRAESIPRILLEAMKIHVLHASLAEQLRLGVRLMT